MNHLVPPPDPPDRPAPLNAFARIVWEVCVVLGGRTRPAGTTPVIAQALVALIYARLRRLEVRFATLVERALAGTLRPVRRRAARAVPARRVRAPDPLPRAAGWLAKLCPYTDWMAQRNLGPAVATMTRLLEDATLRGLLASDPRFGRALRPLWRMLRADPPPDCLRLPPRPRRPRPPRPKPDVGRPIPRGVTRRDLARSRAMAPQAPPQTAASAAPSTDWTPTHLTLGRRASVLDPVIGGGFRRRFGGD